jgi:hypothetical protein
MRKRIAITGLLAAIVTIAFASMIHADGPSRTVRAKTSVVVFSPFTKKGTVRNNFKHGAPVDAKCGPAELSARGNALRCFLKGGVFDPCFEAPVGKLVGHLS